MKKPAGYRIMNIHPGVVAPCIILLLMLALQCWRSQVAIARTSGEADFRRDA
ncbi:MAG: hypothetical protein U9N40_02185 [Euryarchaeota archaeon]|nr:hypothetical protein [Euryarchaeota archaeon]